MTGFGHGKFIWHRNLLRNKHLGFKNQSLRKSFPVSRKGAGFRLVYTLQIRDLGCFVNSPWALAFVSIFSFVFSLISDIIGWLTI
jgi:hypothetical protein